MEPAVPKPTRNWASRSSNPSLPIAPKLLPAVSVPGVAPKGYIQRSKLAPKLDVAPCAGWPRLSTDTAGRAKGDERRKGETMAFADEADMTRVLPGLTMYERRPRGG